MRVRGHSEADKYSYVPTPLLDEWRARDPILLFERRLRGEGHLAPDADRGMQDRIAAPITLARPFVLVENDDIWIALASGERSDCRGIEEIPRRPRGPDHRHFPEGRDPSR